MVVVGVQDLDLVERDSSCEHAAEYSREFRSLHRSRGRAWRRRTADPVFGRVDAQLLESVAGETSRGSGAPRRRVPRLRARGSGRRRFGASGRRRSAAPRRSRRSGRRRARRRTAAGCRGSPEPCAGRRTPRAGWRGARSAARSSSRVRWRARCNPAARAGPRSTHPASRSSAAGLLDQRQRLGAREQAHAVAGELGPARSRASVRTVATRRFIQGCPFRARRSTIACPIAKRRRDEHLFLERSAPADARQLERRAEGPAARPRRLRASRRRGVVEGQKRLLGLTAHRLRHSYRIRGQTRSARKPSPLWTRLQFGNGGAHSAFALSGLADG